MTFKVIIPARYASTRLPGKPLLSIAGKPMIQHVYERAQKSGAADVLIATDDERIQQVAVGFGAHVCMTMGCHSSGTERLAEVVQQLGEPDERIVVNVQADEPLMPPALVSQVAYNLASQPRADVSTLYERITSNSAVFDPGTVKVVLDKDGYALYFSRAPIPWDREHFASIPASVPTDSPHYRHIGLYAYRVVYLRRYINQPPCSLERIEVLEQLRALYEGGRIYVAEADERPGLGVDTPEDLERVRRLFSQVEKF